MRLNPMIWLIFRCQRLHCVAELVCNVFLGMDCELWNSYKHVLAQGAHPAWPLLFTCLCRAMKAVRVSVLLALCVAAGKRFCFNYRQSYRNIEGKSRTYYKSWKIDVLHCMALGRLQERAEYCHGVWELFADMSEKSVLFTLFADIQSYRCIYIYITLYIYIIYRFTSPCILGRVVFLFWICFFK